MQWSYTPQEKAITRARKFCLTERGCWIYILYFSNITVIELEENGLDESQIGNRNMLGSCEKTNKQKMVVVLIEILAVGVGKKE